MTTLIVEDDQNCRRFIVEAISALCEDILTTGKLSEAMTLLDTHIDAVWLDLVLEDAGAAETIASIPIIRERSPKATLIVVSGYGERYREEAMQAGADAYASKVDLHGFQRQAVATLFMKASVRAMERGVNPNVILERVVSFFSEVSRTTLHA